MNKPRKVNTIKALKYEIEYYKKLPVPVKTVHIPLKHIRLQTMYKEYELAMMSKDKISDMIIHKIARTFADSISSMPIEICYDEERNEYRAELDLWVKER